MLCLHLERKPQLERRHHAQILPPLLAKLLGHLRLPKSRTPDCSPASALSDSNMSNKIVSWAHVKTQHFKLLPNWLAVKCNNMPSLSTHCFLSKDLPYIPPSSPPISLFWFSEGHQNKTKHNAPSWESAIPRFKFLSHWNLSFNSCTSIHHSWLWCGQFPLEHLLPIPLWLESPLAPAYHFHNAIAANGPRRS